MHYKRKKYEYFSKDETDLNKMIGVQASSGGTPRNIGPPGPKGFIGPVGPVGPALGDEGPMGPSGKRGKQGKQGIPGLSGKSSDIKGPRGAIGPQGPIGENGNKGLDGPKGRNGIIGIRGIRGPPGDPPKESSAIAPPGPNGSEGANGPKGIKGEKGPVGDIGPQGQIGFTGISGLQGNHGKIGYGIPALFGYGTLQETKQLQNIFTPFINYAANGNIGINIENPERKLHIKNSSNKKPPLLLSTQHGYIDIGANNTSYAHIQTDRSKFWFNKDIEVDGDISAYNNRDLKLKTNNSDRIIISNDKIGIGKNPSDTLDIDGSLKSTSICVGNQCMNEEKLKKMFDYISKPKEQKISSMSFTIDHKDQGWGNICSYYGLYYYDGSKNYGTTYSANRGGYKTSTHTMTYPDPKPIYKPGNGKVWLKAGGEWPGCAIYIKNIRNIKLNLSNGSIINVASMSNTYFTGRGKKKNNEEQAYQYI
jgi:hypothetical protein